MDNDKEMILKLFNMGMSVNGVVESIFNQKKEFESHKNKDDRLKVDKKEIRLLVENTLLEDWKNRMKQWEAS